MGCSQSNINIHTVCNIIWADTIRQVQIPYSAGTLVSSLPVSRRIMMIEVLIILNIMYSPGDYIVSFSHER